MSNHVLYAGVASLSVLQPVHLQNAFSVGPILQIESCFFQFNFVVVERHFAKTKVRALQIIFDFVYLPVESLVFVLYFLFGIPLAWTDIHSLRGHH